MADLTFGAYGMRPDPAPHDVRLAFLDRLTVLKGGACIVWPGFLEDTDGTFDAFDSQPFPEPLVAPQILNKLAHGGNKGR
jgi:hypothetical protein